MQMCDMVMQCDVTKSPNLSETTDEAFEEHCFLWERGVSPVINLQDPE